MRVGIISVFTDYHRRGRHHRGVLQPQVGPLIAGLLPRDAEIDIVNDTWQDPDWSRDYDLLFISRMHSELDRARQMTDADFDSDVERAPVMELWRVTDEVGRALPRWLGAKPEFVSKCRLADHLRRVNDVQSDGIDKPGYEVWQPAGTN